MCALCRRRCLFHPLDVMRDIQKLNYGNNPKVLNELVKFLLVNTKFESIKDLQKSIIELQTEVSSMRKEIANIVKGQHTTSNKVDQLKADTSVLIKRVKALEKL